MGLIVINNSSKFPDDYVIRVMNHIDWKRVKGIIQREGIAIHHRSGSSHWNITNAQKQKAR